jgi:hypothetical protein
MAAITTILSTNKVGDSRTTINTNFSNINSELAGAFQTSSNDSDDITEGATNLFFSSAEQTKLSGIETGAEVNTVNSDPTGVTGADQVINQMSLTAAEYAAIGTPNSATIYYVTDA